MNVAALSRRTAGDVDGRKLAAQLAIIGSGCSRATMAHTWARSTDGLLGVPAITRTPQPGGGSAPSGRNLRTARNRPRLRHDFERELGSGATSGRRAPRRSLPRPFSHLNGNASEESEDLGLPVQGGRQQDLPASDHEHFFPNVFANCGAGRDRNSSGPAGKSRDAAMSDARGRLVGGREFGGFRGRHVNYRSRPGRI